MPTLYAFRCANGHEFEANAKLRTRCPECGISTRRSFAESQRADQAQADDGHRAGDDSHPEPPSTPAQVAQPKRGAVLVRQGKPRVTASRRQHPPVGSRASVASGLVTRRTVRTAGGHPRVSVPPEKTANARQASATNAREHTTPYWHRVADRYGL